MFDALFYTVTSAYEFLTMLTYQISMFFGLCQRRTWVHSVLRHWTFWET